MILVLFVLIQLLILLNQTTLLYKFIKLTKLLLDSHQISFVNQDRGQPPGYCIHSLAIIFPLLV